jgi:hypothetical protein
MQRLAVITAAGGVAGVERPDALTGSGVLEQGSARHVSAAWALPRGRGAVGQFGLPPGPDLALDIVSVGSICEGSVDAEDASCGSAEVALGAGPPGRVLDDQPVCA